MASIQKVKIKKPYDRVEPVRFATSGETHVKQSSRDECNINYIMKKYEKSGLVTHTAQYEGRYGDFIGAPEYHEAMNAVVHADNMFMSIPASVRKRFGNDPAEFLAFAQNPENAEELISMGLAKRPITALTEAEPVAQGEVRDGGEAANEEPSEGS